MLDRFIRYVAYLLFKLLFRLEVRDSHYVPQDGGVIIAANHTSYLDPPIIAVVLKRRPTFIAKSSLYRIPIIGSFIRLYSIGVKREQTGPSTIKKALKTLMSGGCLVIFPEGGRSRDGNLMELKKGLSLIAALSGAPVIPVYIKGAHRVLPVGAKIPRPDKIKVIFGKPVTRRKEESLESYGERVRLEVYSELKRLSSNCYSGH